MTILSGKADPEVEKRSEGKTYNVKLTVSIGDAEKEEKKEDEEEGEVVSKETMHDFIF